MPMYSEKLYVAFTDGITGRANYQVFGIQLNSLKKEFRLN